MNIISKILAATGLLCLMTLNVMAADLIMFDQPGCPWCAKWHAEIGAEGYTASPESKQATLKVYKFGEPMPDNIRALSRTIQGTPTFILLDEGNEVGRIVGYPGKEQFFGRLQLTLDKLSGADKQYKTIIVQ